MPNATGAYSDASISAYGRRSRSRNSSRRSGKRRGQASPRKHKPRPPPLSPPASARAKKLWSRLRQYILDAQPAVQHLVALLEARRIAREAVAEGRVTLEMEEEDEEPSILKQGDLVFYTSASLAARRRLGNHPAILEAIRSHWKALVGYKPEGQRFVEQDEYLRYFLLLHSRLVPDVTEDEARAVVAAEWVKDSKGGDRMDYASFHAALFEVLDTFTASIDLELYIDLAEEHIEAVEELGEQLEAEFIERTRTPDQDPPKDVVSNEGPKPGDDDHTTRKSIKRPTVSRDPFAG